MNPLTNVKNITKLNEIELAKGTKKSWHDIYKDSAWIFIGGLAYGLTEGDILAVFSQYGEIVNINLVRDKKTGKTKGFCFLCYANQKSTVLAVDNINGIKLCNRTIRVDHVANYKPPKEDEKDDEITKTLKSEGCAPKLIQPNENSADDSKVKKNKHKKLKKEKKEHKKKKKRKHHSDESDTGIGTLVTKKVKVKQEKHDPGYDKYDTSKEVRTSKKEESGERRYNVVKCEPSSSRVEFRSDTDKYHRKDNNRIEEHIRHQSRSADREKSGDIDRHNSIRKNYNRNNDNHNKDKRKKNRTTCDDDTSSSSSTDSNRFKNDNNKSKSRHKPSSSKYDSSNDSSSGEEILRHKKSKMMKNVKFGSHEEKVSSRSESRDKYDQRRENFGSISKRTESSYDRREIYSDHRPKKKH